jgi:hypothetical protein
VGGGAGGGGEPPKRPDMALEAPPAFIH